jgi:hypothetical protein
LWYTYIGDYKDEKISFLVANNSDGYHKVLECSRMDDKIFECSIKGAKEGSMWSFYRYRFSVKNNRPAFEINDYAAILSDVANIPDDLFQKKLPTPKKEPGPVKIENGVIYFSEVNAPTVKLGEEAKINFPNDSPKEILGIQGRIYGGGDRPRTYLIPLGYDTGTRLLKLLKVTANEGTKFKPSKYIIGGFYNGPEGSLMKDVNSKPDAPPVLRFYIIPEKQGYKLRIDWETGGSNDLFPIAELPIT